jgi:galactokinase/mevalonate kinase-like predicted kinase
MNDQNEDDSSSRMGEVEAGEIDDVYDQCINAGAMGCKLLGAGGGGYILPLMLGTNHFHSIFYDKTCLNYEISQEGARVVYYD